MNERINSFKKQCTIDKHWDNDAQKWIDGHFDVDKFAKLIVNESVKAIELEVNNWSQLAPFNSIIKQRGVYAIKRHFDM